jgi:hypothetical protein
MHNRKALAWLMVGLLVLAGCSSPLPSLQPGRSYQEQLETLRRTPRLEVSPDQALQAILRAVKETSPEFWRQALPPEVWRQIAPEGRPDVTKLRLEAPLRIESLVRPSIEDVLQLATLNRPEALRIAQAMPDSARTQTENPQEFEALVGLIALEGARALEVAYSGYYVFPVRLEEVGYIGEVYVSLTRLDGRAPSLAAAHYPTPRPNLPYLSQEQAQRLAGSLQEGRLVSLLGLVEGLTREAIWVFGEVAVNAKSAQRYRLVRSPGATALSVHASGFSLPYRLEVLP